MELNKTEEMAVQTSRMIRKLFGDKMSGFVIYDVIDESNHHTFKLKFTVYNFAGVKFQYDNDFFEIYVFFNGDEGLLLSKENSRLGCIFKRNHGKNRIIYPREVFKS